MKLVNMYLFEDYLADSIKIRKKCQISYQPVRWTEPYRIIQKISPILYTLDFHNTAKKIHITHGTPVIPTNETIDEIWHKTHNEDNLE